MWFFQNLNPNLKIWTNDRLSMTIFRVVCQKHVVFAKSESELENLDEWRFSGWFARNIWFFQNTNPKLKIWTNDDFSSFARSQLYFDKSTFDTWIEIALTIS
jgi:hypothetical protein